MCNKMERCAAACQTRLQPAAADRQFVRRVVQALAFSLQAGIAGALCRRRPAFHPGVLPQHVDESGSEQKMEGRREFRQLKFYLRLLVHLSSKWL